LKFKNLLKKKKIKKVKHSRHLGKCHNYGRKGHWANQCPKPKKPRIYKGFNSRTKFAKELGFAKSLIKSKEEALELKVEGETVNVVKEEMKENEAKESVDFFEAIVANLKTGSSKSLANCWYLDLGATKHVSRNKSSFRGLKSSMKIQSVKFAISQTHGLYGKGKVKLSSIFRKTKTISDILYVLGFMTPQEITVYLIRKLNHKLVILTFG